jgi:ABC-type antimicrobial peptide transport system permease subunit
MTARDLFELAARNLREAVLRNSLTTLGVGVGVASLVAMLSLGVGLQTMASQRLTRSGLFDAVFVTSPRGFGGPGGPGGGPGSRGGANSSRANNGSATKTGAKSDPKLLDEDARKAFATILNVTEVYPQIRFSAQFVFEKQPETTSVMGLPESSRSSIMDGLKGSYFSLPNANEVILQAEFAKSLAAEASNAAANSLPNSGGDNAESAKTAEPDTARLIGKEAALRYAERSVKPAAEMSDEDLLDAAAGVMGGGLSVTRREKKFRIVGIAESDPSAGFGGFGGARVYLPLAVAESLNVAQPTDLQGVFGGEAKATYMALTVRAKSPTAVPQIEDAIKKMGYNAFSLLDATRGLRIFFSIFDLLLGLFGSLALTVASLGIINTLVMAILERRREIGVLKALGASDGDVKSLFFAEAGTMGLFGGVFGVALGWVIGRALTFGASIYLNNQGLPSVKISYVPWWLALGAVGFAVLVSLAAGLYPATRAAKLNPVEALRYE